VDKVFQSDFLGGFECSTHRRADGERLDLLASSNHDELARRDYAQLACHGITGARDGVRWHLVERTPGHYDWSSFLPMLHAARFTGMQVAWDLCHYGWPDDIDVWSEQFVTRFAKFAAAVARLVRDETELTPVYCPINEISYWAWAGAEVGRMNPAVHGQGGALKRQLVRASVAAIHAIRDVDARARFTVAEPLINVVSGSEEPPHRDAAEAYRRSQFEVHDMLCGRVAPELGGRADCLDLIGVNFYPDNQWYLHGSTIPLGHHAYQPLRAMLQEVHERYERPLWISETGAEGIVKPYWLHHVCAEVLAARRNGVAVHGVCLYPVLDYHGWDNGRICEVGLLSLPDQNGERRICTALLEELQHQQARFTEHAPHTRVPPAQQREYVRYG
jgi:beta-glucosidase/6-phospho-beta-glucosidase/beta-galactosidase